MPVGKPDKTVAIVDTGIDKDHPDLAGKVIGGYDVVNGDGDATDDNGHGTYVAGIVSAVTTISLGIAASS